MIEIIKAQNGFICEWWEEIENTHVKQQVVFEDDESDLTAIRKTLYHILEHFGLYGSKHDKERIRIEIVQGNTD